MASSQYDDVPISEMKKTTGIDDNRFQQLFLRLSAKGLAYRSSRGQYSFTLPLFKDYIKRQY